MFYGLNALDLLASNYGVKASNLIYCSFDFCAVFLCGVVLINYFVSKRLTTRSAIYFQALLIATLVSSVVHCLASITYSVIPSPDWVKFLFRTLYYLLYNGTGIIFLVYSVSVICENKSLPRSLAVMVVVFTTLSAAAVIIYCISQYALGGNATQEYVCKGLVYTAQISALSAALVSSIVNRKRLRPVQRLNVYCFTLLNILAAVLQFTYQTLQISSFCMALAILLIYITLQRPEDEIDAVTGMFNQKTFVRRVNDRLSSKIPFIVFAAEINNIAIVNGAFGMHGGNELIQEFSKRVKRLIGKNVYLYRLGGVKFAVVFNNEAEYDRFRESYASLFEEPYALNGTSMRVSATACVIKFPEITDKVSDVEEIIRYYRTEAKTSDNIFVADKEAVERSRRREQIDYAIQRALKNHALEVYYQPIYCVRNGKINSCEALVRLNDPELGKISPDEFIPVAEQTGRIVEVGKFVMEEVCKFLSEFNPSEYGLEFVDVNLSVIQCMHPEVIQTIDETLKAYNIPRKMVNLEVTETASAQSYALLQSRLNELHQSGLTISLDDFGTGFASVEYLINFPFDVVKLDKSIVWAYMSTKKYEPILKHYIPMLHGLGTRIVAEGVETEEMVTTLKRLGCDYLQGFYFSKPVPKEKFLEYLKDSGNIEIA